MTIRGSSGRATGFHDLWAGNTWAIAGPLSGLAAILLVFIFWDTAASAVRVWQDSETYTHGFLIAPIVAFLIWRRREFLAGIEPAPDFRGLALLAAAATAWLLGSVAGVKIVEQFALVSMILALVYTLLGGNVVRALAFPLAYLYFAVPVGDFLVPPLQDFTAVFTVKALRLAGVPVYLDGIFISIPKANFEVAEACAGVRFLIAMVALGCLYAYFTYRSLTRRLGFIALSFAVPILANGVRAFGIVMLAHVTDNQVAIGVDHVLYGWLFFSLVMFLLLGIGMMFRDQFGDGETPASPVPGAAVARRPASFVLAAVAGLALVASAPAYALYVDGRPADSVARTIEPAVAPPWTAMGESTDWQPDFRAADLTVTRTFSAGGRKAHLAVVYFARQRQGAEVVNFFNSLGGGERWLRAGSGSDRATVDGQSLDVAYTRFVSSHGGRLVWHWYWVDGSFTGSPYVAKLLEVRAKLLGGIQGAAVVAVAADYTDVRAEAAATLQDLLDNMDPLGPALARMAGR